MNRRTYAIASACFAVITGAAWSAPSFANSPEYRPAEEYSSNFGTVVIRKTSGLNYSGTYLNGGATLYGRRSGNKFIGQWVRRDGSSERCDYPVDGSYHWGHVILQFTSGGFTGMYGTCNNPPSNRWSGQTLVIQPLPAPQPQAVRLDGWWRGDRSGYYSIQSSGSTFQMKGHTNAGVPFNLYEGTIIGNQISGRWTNFCGGASGNATLLYQNGIISRIAGNTTNSSWSPSSPPANLQAQPNCNTSPQPPQQPQPQPIRLDGWWRGDRGGYYSIQSSGSTFEMKGFTDAGVPLTLYEGTINGNQVSGRWRNFCGGAAGSATLRYQNGIIQRVGGNFSLMTNSWSRSSRPANLQAQPNCRSN